MQSNFKRCKHQPLPPPQITEIPKVDAVVASLEKNMIFSLGREFFPPSQGHNRQEGGRLRRDFKSYSAALVVWASTCFASTMMSWLADIKDLDNRDHLDYRSILKKISLAQVKAMPLGAQYDNKSLCLQPSLKQISNNPCTTVPMRQPMWH